MSRMIAALAVGVACVATPTLATAQGPGTAYMGCIHTDYESKKVYLSRKGWVEFVINRAQIVNGIEFTKYLQANHRLREGARNIDCSYSLKGRQAIDDRFARTREIAARDGLTVVETFFVPKSVD